MSEIFSDPTPDALINLRIAMPLVMLTESTTLTLAERREFTDILVFVAKKLVAVWRHLSAYCELEERLISQEEVRDLSADRQGVEFRYSQDLFLEFDGFLVQTKSCLDYMVKVPRPILGGNRWNVRTFGDKGEKVLKAIRGSLNARDRRMALGFMNHILGTNGQWLKVVIDARDRVNHFQDGGISFETFLVRKIRRNGVEGVVVPMWTPQEQIHDSLNFTWGRLVSLVEDFVGGFLGLRLKPGLALFHNAVPDGVPNSCWQVVPEEFMKREIQRPGWEEVPDEEVR